MTAPTRPESSVCEPTLYVAFEVSAKQWKLALTTGFGVEPWVTTVAARDLGGVRRAIAHARGRFRVSEETPVVSCYEAGRDGFWIHRALTQVGVANRVVDSASIEVNRRARRAKTDRIDAMKLVRMLVRVCGGERGVWSEVRVPTVAAEAARQVSRERTTLTQDQTRLVNQMRGWLATWGATLPSRRRGAWWTRVQDWAGAAGSRPKSTLPTSFSYGPALPNGAPFSTTSRRSIRSRTTRASAVEATHNSARVGRSTIRIGDLAVTLRSEHGS